MDVATEHTELRGIVENQLLLGTLCVLCGHSNAATALAGTKDGTKVSLSPNACHEVAPPVCEAFDKGSSSLNLDFSQRRRQFGGIWVEVVLSTRDAKAHSFSKWTTASVTSPHKLYFFTFHTSLSKFLCGATPISSCIEKSCRTSEFDATV